MHRMPVAKHPVMAQKLQIAGLTRPSWSLLAHTQRSKSCCTYSRQRSALVVVLRLIRAASSPTMSVTTA